MEGIKKEKQKRKSPVWKLPFLVAGGGIYTPFLKVKQSENKCNKTKYERLFFRRLKKRVFRLLFSLDFLKMLIFCYLWLPYGYPNKFYFVSLQQQSYK